MISAAVVTRLFIMYTFYCVQFVHVFGKGRGYALC